ncbi:MAG: acetolactate synthase-1/2/3 large subunit [Psychromonas sp.]|jgi:acetolactate synthase-1/2/3 large subunit
MFIMSTCGEVLIQALENYAVDTVFGIRGVHTIELYRGLAKSNIKHISPRHEKGAGFMADGYARATGKPGTCFIITGPGMTNIITAMGQALQDSIPMLVISSVNHSKQLGMGEGFLHELPNQSALVAGVSRFSHRLTHVDQLPKVLARAFSVFSSERPGPVHIELPLDVIKANADHLDNAAFAIADAPGASPDAVAQAARLLQQATRPLIAISGGAVNAGHALIALAEKINAPVINTVNAKGLIPYTHPLAVGGSSSSNPIREELRHADVVLAVGTEFGETDYDFFGIGGKLIRIDIDPRQLSRNVKPHLAICSDAAYALTAINKALTLKPESNGQNRVQALRQKLRAGACPKYAAFFSALNESLPEVIIAGDSTQPTYYAWLHYETLGPRRYFHSASGYGTLGYAIPAAVGAKLVCPDKAVIGLIGDGAAQFSIAELASAVEAQVLVIFIIWNNKGYGEISRFMDNAGVERVGVDIYTPDFIKIAEGFGCATAKPSTIDALKAALIKANKQPGPTVIEVMQQDFADAC